MKHARHFNDVYEYVVDEQEHAREMMMDFYDSMRSLLVAIDKSKSAYKIDAVYRFFEFMLGHVHDLKLHMGHYFRDRLYDVLEILLRHNSRFAMEYVFLSEGLASYIESKPSEFNPLKDEVFKQYNVWISYYMLYVFSKNFGRHTFLTKKDASTYSKHIYDTTLRCWY